MHQPTKLWAVMLQYTLCSGSALRFLIILKFSAIFIIIKKNIWCKHTTFTYCLLNILLSWGRKQSSCDADRNKIKDNYTTSGYCPVLISSMSILPYVFFFSFVFVNMILFLNNYYYMHFFQLFVFFLPYLFLILIIL